MIIADLEYVIMSKQVEGIVFFSKMGQISKDMGELPLDL
jgi:hypothetical protein